MLPVASGRMTVNVRQYLDNPGKRFPVDLTLPCRREADDGLRTVQSVRLEGEAFSQLSTLYLSVKITAPVEQPCRRCLEPVVSTVEIHEELDVPIPPGAETVDLLPDVVRLVLSAHDPNVLCCEDCRGLCPVCGADLNRDPDHACEEDEDDRRTLGDLLTWPDGS